MKKYFQRTLATLMVCAIAATTFAEKVRKEHVTLTSDVMVNGTLVKAGEYDIRFDEKAGELSILKNGKVKAADAIKGAVMRETKGMAKMELVQRLVMEALQKA